jgi:hypothetical protein
VLKTRCAVVAAFVLPLLSYFNLVLIWCCNIEQVICTYKPLLIWCCNICSAPCLAFALHVVFSARQHSICWSWLSCVVVNYPACILAQRSETEFFGCIFCILLCLDEWHIRFIMISQETMETMLVPPVSKLIAEFFFSLKKN